MSGECDKCGEHTVDCKCVPYNACADCFEAMFHLPIGFDWDKVKFRDGICFCGGSPVVQEDCNGDKPFRFFEDPYSEALWNIINSVSDTLQTRAEAQNISRLMWREYVLMEMFKRHNEEIEG